MIILYGITNCSTVAKARTCLETNRIEYNFHGYKKEGIDTEHLQRWCGEFGWKKVLNRAGMMWRKSSETEKDRVIDQATATEFILPVSTSIKRPILESENGLFLGLPKVCC
jgi:arsenate reductase (glutaredoxin)